MSCNVLHAVVPSTSAVPSVLKHPPSRDTLWYKWQNKCHLHLKVSGRIYYIYKPTSYNVTLCSLCPQHWENLKLHSGPLKLRVFIEILKKS